MLNLPPMSSEPKPDGPNYHALALLDLERHLLQRTAAGEPVDAVLEDLLRSTAQRVPRGSLTALWRLSADQSTLQLGPAPGCPPALAEALAELDVRTNGAAPALAAQRGQSVYSSEFPDAVPDDKLRAACRAFGIRACWATPLRDGSGLLGVYAVLPPTAELPGVEEVDDMAVVARVATLVMERERIDRRLQATEHHYRQILDSASDYAIISLDVAGRVTSWNAGAQQLLGWTEPEMRGHTLHRLFEQPAMLDAELARAGRDGQAGEDGWRLRRDGSRFWASGQISRLQDDDGQPIGYVKILRDRTRQRMGELRQDFLFELSTTLDEAHTPEQIAEAIAPRLGHLLEVEHVSYAAITPGGLLETRSVWRGSGDAPAEPAPTLLLHAPALLSALQQGRPVAVPAAAHDPIARPLREAAQIDSGVAGLVYAPLLDSGVLVGLLALHTRTPRLWSDHDLGLLAEVMQRMHQVIERQRTQEALRRTEERFQFALEAGNVGAFELFAETGRVAVSSTFCGLWGLPVTPVVEVQTLVDLTLPEDRPLLAATAEQLARGNLRYAEYRIRRADTGETRWLARRGTELHEATNGTTRQLGVVYDITDRQNAVLQLRASQESLALAADAAEVGIWDVDPATGRITWNARTYAMFGLTPGRAVNVEVFERGVHEDDRPAVMGAFVAALDPARRQPYDVQYRTVGLEDGRLRWVAAKGRGLFNEVGQCVRAVGTAVDITEQRDAEHRRQFLLELTDRLRSLSAPRDVLSHAASGLSRYLGARRAEFLDRSAGARLTLVVGASAQGTEPRDADDQAPRPRRLQQLLRDSTGTVVIGESAGQDGATRPGDRSLVAVPLRRDGRVAGWLVVSDVRPRAWSRAEIGLVEEVAGRVYSIFARAQAESALREEREALQTLNALGVALASEFDVTVLARHVVEAGIRLTGASFGAFLPRELPPEDTEDGDAAGVTIDACVLGLSQADFDRRVLPQLHARYGAGLEITRLERVTLGRRRATVVEMNAPAPTDEPRRARPDADTPGGTAPGDAGLVAGAFAVEVVAEDTSPQPLDVAMASLARVDDEPDLAAGCVATPVVSREGLVLGSLLFCHSAEAHFGDTAVERVAGLAAQAAIALDNARLFSRVQRARAVLETRVEERTRERDQTWELSQDLLVVAGTDGTLIRVSPSWSRALGCSPPTLLATNWYALLPEEDRPALRSAIQSISGTGQPIALKTRMLHAEGGHRWLAWTLTPEPGGQRIFGAGRDFTDEHGRQIELNETQEALRQAQKMEAVGQLTGGIAHDFNNLLQGITAALEVAQRRAKAGQPVDYERYIGMAMKSAQRAAGLTHRLLAFSRRQPLDPKPVEVDPLVASMAELLTRTLGESISLRIETDSLPWVALCDPNPLERALLNLCINARDAMPGGGSLTVSTSRLDVDAHPPSGLRGLPAGQYLCIRVSDTGMGMSSEVAARAFEPFFTTKPQGQGTGLGLAMIYGFAKQSRGLAALDTAPGQGTAITICLPRHVGDAAIAGAPAREGESRGHGETVLVVEDEAPVRELVTGLLEEQGYRVLQAADSVAALEILRSSRMIDLLLTDIGLPGMNGRDMAGLARASRPSLPVLFMTGYAEGAATATGFLSAGMAMITKPFELDALLARLRNLLDR